jgi:hypothetical protein
MNRAFKIQFHNGEPDEKTIVTMSLTVNNGKLFDALDNEGKNKLIKNIGIFKVLLKSFADEISGSITKPI